MQINSRLKAATTGADVTVDWILRQLQATYRRATEDRKYSAAVRRLELQGKYLKMFSERIEHVQTIEDVSTEQLVELLYELIGSGVIDLDSLLKSAA